MRAITGLVGKRNRDNYQITTTTATIGIRGSAFSANYNPDGSLNVAGEQDGIVVCTNAGCVELIVGEVVRVTDANSLPARTAERSNVPPLVARQDLFEPENPLIIQQIALPQQNLVNGVLTGVSAMFAFGNGSIDSYPRGGEHPSDGQGTFVDGQMVKTCRFEQPEREHRDRGKDQARRRQLRHGRHGPGSGLCRLGLLEQAGSITGNMDDLRLGFSEGSNYDEGPGVHSIVGRPTPITDMPMTGTANFALIGGTAPTAYDGEILRVGTLAGAGLNVDFGAGRVNAFVNTVFTVGEQSVPVQISGYGYVEGTRFYSDDYGSGYYYGEGGSFYGFFIGSQAMRAGLVYQGYAGSVGTVQGAAVFLKTGGGLAFTEQAGMSAMFTSIDDYVDDYYPRGGIDPSTGTGYFVGNQLYLHDDGEDSYDGYEYGTVASTYRGNVQCRQPGKLDRQCGGSGFHRLGLLGHRHDAVV